MHDSGFWTSSGPSRWSSKAPTNQLPVKRTLPPDIHEIGEVLEPNQKRRRMDDETLDDSSLDSDEGNNYQAVQAAEPEVTQLLQDPPALQDQDTAMVSECQVQAEPDREGPQEYEDEEVHEDEEVREQEAEMREQEVEVREQERRKVHEPQHQGAAHQSSEPMAMVPQSPASEHITVVPPIELNRTGSESEQGAMAISNMSNQGASQETVELNREIQQLGHQDGNPEASQGPIMIEPGREIREVPPLSRHVTVGTQGPVEAEQLQCCQSPSVTEQQNTTGPCVVASWLEETTAYRKKEVEDSRTINRNRCSSSIEQLSYELSIIALLDFGKRMSQTDALCEAAEKNEAQVMRTTLTEESNKLCHDLPQRCIEFARGQPITDNAISCAERWSMEMFEKGVEYAQTKGSENCKVGISHVVAQEKQMMDDIISRTLETLRQVQTRAERLQQEGDAQFVWKAKLVEKLIPGLNLLGKCPRPNLRKDPVTLDNRDSHRSKGAAKAAAEERYATSLCGKEAANQEVDQSVANRGHKVRCQGRSSRETTGQESVRLTLRQQRREAADLDGDTTRQRPTLEQSTNESLAHQQRQALAKSSNAQYQRLAVSHRLLTAVAANLDRMRQGNDVHYENAHRNVGSQGIGAMEVDESTSPTHESDLWFRILNACMEVGHQATPQVRDVDRPRPNSVATQTIKLVIDTRPFNRPEPPSRSGGMVNNGSLPSLPMVTRVTRGPAAAGGNGEMANAESKASPASDGDASHEAPQPQAVMVKWRKRRGKPPASDGDARHEVPQPAGGNGEMANNGE
ncbi:hypothetical protein BC826DRAFT_973000, partial [Russula brevipes]